MSKSLLTISVMGFLCVALMVVAMLASLSMFQGTPAAERTKLSLQIQNEFKFEAVGTHQVEIPVMALQVRYETRGPLPTLEDQQKEMEAVAAFTVKHYDNENRRLFREVRVFRRHVSGRGCWTNTYDNTYTLKDPPWPKPPRGSRGGGIPVPENP